MGRTASGVRGIRLRDEDYVIGSAVLKENQEVLVITEKGYGPLSVINKMSSSPVTVVSPASGPFFSLTLAVLIPLPPRPLTGYSESFVSTLAVFHKQVVQL
jgi:hypothetical protein